MAIWGGSLDYTFAGVQDIEKGSFVVEYKGHKTYPTSEMFFFWGGGDPPPPPPGPPPPQKKTKKKTKNTYHSLVLMQCDADSKGKTLLPVLPARDWEDGF